MSTVVGVEPEARMHPGLEAAHNPRPAVPARVLLGIIGGYRWFSRLVPNRCRYWPTCSQYALDAVSGWGAIRGSWMALRRIGRCHPWGGSGLDPVPTRAAHATSGCSNTSSLDHLHPLRADDFSVPDEVGSPCSPR